MYYISYIYIANYLELGRKGACRQDQKILNKHLAVLSPSMIVVALLIAEIYTFIQTLLYLQITNQCESQRKGAEAELYLLPLPAAALGSFVVSANWQHI